ncbi:CapA family protein [Sporosarcina cyprini]|uniref:CapA family protein n=1 Tax=Sporosarcina cyprini TaxID=2910523 RepID=UPI001EDFE7BF|nr:CapA family protein [Sporosarcina cyprini]MCG3088237.1 CapA family protein [Sporosarcina cyprini]
MREIVFTATGDSFITRRLPEEDERFGKLSSLLKEADVRFTNLEVTIHDGEGIPGAVSGGTWAKAKPAVLQDIKRYGFNLVAWTNNHTLDYSVPGLLATERYLEEHGFVHGGAGADLASASEPRYLETTAGRVAMIAATSTFHESWAAGDQRRDMKGRPGVNPLRFDTVHLVSKEQLEHLKRIASSTAINAAQNLSIKEGFKKERTDGVFSFGAHLFQESEHQGKMTSPAAIDMDRIIRSIHEAKRQADYVFVSLHAHEMEGEVKEKPARFIEDFSRRCIDEGAHMVVGHGPHILRGIEIYKNRPIFYSLGNFIFQNETVTHLPADFYQAYGLTDQHNVADALDTRSRGNSIGFGINPAIWETVLPIWKMKDGELTELVLHPVELGFGKKRYERGWPELSGNQAILERLCRLSKEYGTELEIDGGVAKVLLHSQLPV